MNKKTCGANDAPVECAVLFALAALAAYTGGVGVYQLLRRETVSDQIVRESFFRTSDGKLVLVTHPGMGVSAARSYAHMHGFSDNGFPEGHPSEEELSAKHLWRQWYGISAGASDAMA
ncbi:MAG: hypothetical protein Q8O33_13550 [Pseudomonadota bacterium]|nr:hypothetical protein [Pseudomonadota bacterium]